METFGLNIALILATALAGLILVLRSRIRTAQDVACDLEEVLLESASSARDRNETKKAIAERMHSLLNDEIGKLGLYSASDRAKFRLQARLFPLIGALLALLLRLLMGPTTVILLILTGIFGFALGYLGQRMRVRNLQRKHIREIEFFLPVVMERVVMAVQAGLDILPGIKEVIDLEDLTRAHVKGRRDPVTALLRLVYQLTESGLSFEQSLNDISKVIECSSLRHAFLHLAMAQKEGGELVLPLRELSDSTQLYYQESTEEEIAKMPVKAMLPLLCTFAGLIICFITSPLIQVINVATNAMPK